jgi:hypothetical protein
MRGEQAVPECRSLGTGGDTELLPQRPVQAVELAQRGVPVAVGRVPPHQGQVGALVARVELGHLLPAADQAQQVQLALPELLARCLGPLLVPVRGQQFAAVQRERLAGGRGIPGGERPAGQFGEPDRVDGHAAAGTQDDLVAAQHHRVRHAEGTPGEVRRLVQLRHRLGDRVLRPDPVDNLLAMQPPPRRQREHLHHRRRVAAIPAGLGDRGSADRHGEPAEQRDVDIRHRDACRCRFPQDRLRAVKSRYSHSITMPCSFPDLLPAAFPVPRSWRRARSTSSASSAAVRSGSSAMAR